MRRGSKPGERHTPPGRLEGALFEAPETRAPHATKPRESRGRYFPEPESATRTCYQRDRDRIIHSTAFRRLKHKTQVFVQHEGDYYRTRLTHSLEVAQIARSLARVLALDEDLAEAVALAHDLGHTPFGHAGEDALDEAARQFGGFDHNAHALRLVTRLEHRYAEFDGLNLTWETLEGLVKHNGPLAVGGCAVPAPIAAFDAQWPLELAGWPGLEAQVAALSDDIAYVNHDIDDGLRAGLFSPQDLREAPLAGPCVVAVQNSFGQLETGRLVGEIVRRLMSLLVSDLLAETQRRIARTSPKDVRDVRNNTAALAAFSMSMAADLAALKNFLFTRMYRHPRVMGAMNTAKRAVADLFRAFLEDPGLLPEDWARACDRASRDGVGAIVRDYIAGMTDRYTALEFRRVFHTDLEL